MSTVAQILLDTKTRYRHIYSDATVIGWLDIVQQKLWNIVPRDATPVTVTLNGTGQYALPTGIKRRNIKQVSMGPTGGTFTILPYRELHEVDGKGYSLLNNFIQVTEPTPTVPPTVNELHIFYDKVVPTPLASLPQTALPELDETYHELLTLGLLEMIAGARKDIKMKNNYGSEFNTLLGDFMIERIDDEPDYPSCKDELPRRARYGRTVE